MCLRLIRFIRVCGKKKKTKESKVAFHVDVIALIPRERQTGMILLLVNL